jgi:hypothetical protein
MVRKAHKIARYELNSVFGLEKVDRWNPIRTSAIQSSWNTHGGESNRLVKVQAFFPSIASRNHFSISK